MTDKIISFGDMKHKKKYYLVVINEKESSKGYFINTSSNYIKKLILKFSGMVTYDDKAVKTSTKNKIYEDIELESCKFIKIIGKYGHGDFMTYYYFEIITEENRNDRFTREKNWIYGNKNTLFK